MFFKILGFFLFFKIYSFKKIEKFFSFEFIQFGFFLFFLRNLKKLDFSKCKLVQTGRSDEAEKPSKKV